MNINVVFKIYNRLTYLWVPIFIIFIIGNTIMMIYGAVGLSESQNILPHQYDGHKYMSYTALWNFMDIWPLVSLSISLISVFALVFSKISIKQKEEKL